MNPSPYANMNNLMISEVKPNKTLDTLTLLPTSRLPSAVSYLIILSIFFHIIIFVYHYKQ